jgi:hypothetical protein
VGRFILIQQQADELDEKVADGRPGLLNAVSRRSVNSGFLNHHRDYLGRTSFNHAAIW